MSPQEIMKELKIVGLVKPGIKSKNLEDYIRENMLKQWNEENKTWEDIDQCTIFDKFPSKLEDDLEWKDLLSTNDSNTLLKDMKYILSNLKKVTNDIAKITKDIDMMVSIVKDKKVE